MAKELIVLNGALVVCSMTQKPTDNGMADIENFTIYRIINISGDNNGIFGMDEAYLTENSAGAYLDIKNFPVCYAPNYVSALQDIIDYLNVLEKNSEDDNEKELIRERRQSLTDFQTKAVEAQYPQNSCIMELLDHWFNCSDKVFLDNNVEILQNIKSTFQEKIDSVKELRDAVQKDADDLFGPIQLPTSLPTDSEAKVEAGGLESQLTVGNSAGDSSDINMEVENSNTQLTKQEQKVLKKDQNQVNSVLAEIDSFCKSLEESCELDMFRILLDGSDNYIDYKPNKLKEQGQNADGIIESQINQLKDSDLNKIISKYNLSTKYNELVKYLESVKKDFTELITSVHEIQDRLEDQAVVTQDSYLMCRCGGKISIVDTGQWINDVNLMVEEDIKNIFLYAEEQIYGFLKNAKVDEPITEDYNNSRYSLIIALNGIHCVLESLGENGKYTDIENSEEIKKKYPFPNISIDITPQKEIENRENKKAIIREAGDSLPFGLDWIFKVLFFMEDMSNSYKSSEVADVFKENVVGVVKKLGNELYEGSKDVGNLYGDLVNSSGVKMAETGAEILKWGKLLHDYMRKSYAVFIGEVVLNINTGWDKHFYKVTYNEKGERTSDIQSKSVFLSRDMFTNLGCANYEGGNYMFGIFQGDKSK